MNPSRHFRPDRSAADQSPGAGAKVVDRLLDSPRHGEHWAQHWLDVVRFAESEGDEYDRRIPGVRRYRDYVIAAFNRDKPSDRFLTEQQAGDEIGPDDPECLAASAFHRLGPVRRNAGNPEIALSRNEVLTERTDAIGAVFLGLTVGCARCHNHKLEPIPQKDYHRLQAYLAATDEHNKVIAGDVERRDWEAKMKVVKDEMERVRQQARQAAGKERERLTAEVEELEDRLPDPPPTIPGTANDFARRTKIHVLKRGDWENKGEAVGPRPLGVLSSDDLAELPAGVADPRTRLARWLASPGHPLTARVIVNRVWQHHFGVGLVKTANDFGIKGDRPSHPELLDWLAAGLIDNGWRLKPIHRAIVLSATYRQSRLSPVAAEAARDDPENRLLWRFNRRRLAAEEVRDAMPAAERGAAAGTSPGPAKAKAKAVIFLFMAGGPSHLETFDPKPLLNRLNGQVRPAEFGAAKYQFVARNARLMGTRRTFRKHGASGIEVSDLFPLLSRHVDDMAVVRSCRGDMVVHSAAQYELFTGRVAPGFPSMGSWVLYGLGSGSDSLPSYVVMPDPKGALEAWQPMYMNGFLPAVYQPTMFRPSDRPVLNLDLPPGVAPPQRRKMLDLIRDLNRAEGDPLVEEFSARINAYDLGFKMQTEAPAVLDLSREPRETLDPYGVGREPTNDYGRRCLLARKLVEEGVRFVCVVSGGGPANSQWDAHGDVEENHLRKAAETDRPIAGLLTDLKRRGLLDSTLVLWGGEFGRSPEAESGRGRDHHNLGFSMWLAGGGVKGDTVVGATDAIGLHAIESPYHLRDVHTTILHQLGLNQHALTYPHLGRAERLTFVAGKVIREAV